MPREPPERPGRPRPATISNVVDISAGHVSNVVDILVEPLGGPGMPPGSPREPGDPREADGGAREAPGPTRGWTTSWTSGVMSFSTWTRRVPGASTPGGAGWRNREPRGRPRASTPSGARSRRKPPTESGARTSACASGVHGGTSALVNIPMGTFVSNILPVLPCPLSTPVRLGVDVLSRFRILPRSDAHAPYLYATVLRALRLEIHSCVSQLSVD